MILYDQSIKECWSSYSDETYEIDTGEIISTLFTYLVKARNTKESEYSLVDMYKYLLKDLAYEGVFGDKINGLMQTIPLVNIDKE